MKRVSTLLALAAIICLTAFATSCIYDASTGEIVVTERICVNMNQYETDGDIDSRQPCDKFRERILNKISDYGATMDDLTSLSLVSGTYKLVKLQGHDWTIDADIIVFRKDSPGGSIIDGPETLIEFNNQSLAALKGAPTHADLSSDGVALLNRALDDLLEGDDPLIYFGLQNDTITPVPSMSDPLEFRWLGCVTLQATVDVD